MKKDQLPLFWDLQFNEMKECKKGKSRIGKTCSRLLCLRIVILLFMFGVVFVQCYFVIYIWCCVCPVLFVFCVVFAQCCFLILTNLSHLDDRLYWRSTKGHKQKQFFNSRYFLLRFCCVQLFPSGFFYQRWRRKSDIGHRRHCDESDNLPSCFCLLTLCKAWRYQTTMTAKLSDLPL